MARVKVDLPDQLPFSTEMNVRISDVNYGGHLGNDAVLSLAHEARVRFLGEHGLTEKEIFGYGIIMVDAAIQYKAEAFHGDRIMIAVGVTDIGRVGCDFVYRFTEKSSGKEIARVKTGIAFFDYSSRKLVETPVKFAFLFNNLAPST